MISSSELESEMVSTLTKLSRPAYPILFKKAIVAFRSAKVALLSRSERRLCLSFLDWPEYKKDVAVFVQRNALS